MNQPLVSRTYWRGTWIRFREQPDMAEVEVATVNAHDGAQIRGLYWTPKGRRAKTAIMAAHPRVDFSQHYSFPDFLRAGYACLGANLRSINNDVNCVHEQLVLDLGAYARWLKDEKGIEKIVWLGNSGGGSLGGFYQQQAKAAPTARIGRTPAGRPVPLADANLPPFDAMLITAAHTGQGLIMNDVIDPAVVDEKEPLLTDPALDLYDPRNGFKPAPAWSEYDDAFLKRYRAAQVSRVARIDAIARSLLARQADAEAARADPAFARLPFERQRVIQQRASFQPVMTIYRTMANPNYVDRRLDPSNRGYGCLLSERPDLMNYQLLGFGRLQTPDAWLSTWSGLSSNANLLKTAAAIAEPAAVVNAGRDRDVYPETHSKAIFRALATKDKAYFEFPNRLHYFEPDEGEDPTAPVRELMGTLLPWLQERCPA
jgi:alpha-beta hydrolase superfamily lysophospholipase